MDISVRDGDGTTITLARAILRYVGLVLATIPLFAGFVPVLFDDRRRAVQDWLARSVVVAAVSSEPQVPPSEPH
jgi:hypothetical protein